MATITARRVGNSVGFTIPVETCNRLGIEAGRTLTLIESEEGFKVTKRNPDLEQQLALADEVLRSEREVLQILARR